MMKLNQAQFAPAKRPVQAAGLMFGPQPRHRIQVQHICRAQKVSEFPASLQKIVGAFQMVPDPMARYKQLLYYANKIEPLPAGDHVPENKVEGCVSQVWVKPELRADGKIYWKADSDSQLTKGLAALLVLGLSGCTAAEILSIQPTFIELLGLKQSLTPSRNNGFLNMFKLMQRKAVQLAAAEAQGTANGSSNGSSHAPEAAAATPSTSSGSASSHSQNGHSSKTPIQDSMRQKITEALKPSTLVIINQSDQHAGHAGVRTLAGKAAMTGETHFRVEVVSEAFEGMNLVKRQRAIYQLLQDEFAQGLHALSLDTRTPAEANQTA